MRHEHDTMSASTAPEAATQTITSEEALQIRGGVIPQAVGVGVAVGLAMVLAGRYINKALDAAEAYDKRTWKAVSEGAKSGARSAS